MNDELLSVLPPLDVGAARAERLRRRCHAALRAGTPPAREASAAGWERWLAPAVGGAWSAIYALETLRRALAFYRP